MRHQQQQRRRQGREVLRGMRLQLPVAAAGVYLLHVLSLLLLAWVSCCCKAPCFDEAAYSGWSIRVILYTLVHHRLFCMTACACYELFRRIAARGSAVCAAAGQRCNTLVRAKAICCWCLVVAAASAAHIALLASRLPHLTLCVLRFMI